MNLMIRSSTTRAEPGTENSQSAPDPCPHVLRDILTLPPPPADARLTYGVAAPLDGEALLETLWIKLPM